MGDWRAMAACRTADPELFHPAGAARGSYAEGKKFCARCKVKAECLRYCLDFEYWSLDYTLKQGLYGGMSPYERVVYIKKLRAEDAIPDDALTMERLAQIRVGKILALHDYGLGTSDIGSALGMHNGTVRRILAEHNRSEHGDG